MFEWLREGKLKPRFVVLVDREGMKARDYNAAALVLGVERGGSFYFCWRGELHVAPLNDDGSVSMEESTLVTSYESPEELEELKRIAEKLNCKLAI